MKIYTRTGDTGETSLLGGRRVPKHDTRVTAYGTVDELNAALGLALALGSGRTAGAAEPGEGSGSGLAPEDLAALEVVQHDLFTIGAWLAADPAGRARRKGLVPDLPQGRVAELEAWIDRLEDELPELDAFVLPGGSPAGAQLHVARTVCRRAERWVVALTGSGTGEEEEKKKKKEEEDGAGEGGGRGAATEDTILPYLNRLSDLLFTLARHVNRRAGAPETRWLPVRERRGGEEGS